MNPVCSVCERVRLAREGKLPGVIQEFANSFLVAGDHAFYPGYCVLLAKTHARELHELPSAELAGLWDELLRASRAIAEEFKPHKLNHASLGNVDPHVHWHIFPRYTDDPNLPAHPWANAAEFARFAMTDEGRAELRARLGARLGAAGG